jgi:uncharacterized protein YndB with AHSA1/START domain
MLTLILIALVVLVAIALIFAATKPDTFRIERSINIKAPPEKIFPLIADFHKMNTWSAWEKIDPAMKRTYSGADSGVGAKYAWDGNKEIGQGSMEILEATPSSKVLIKLDFYKPFEAHNMAEFTLVSHGETTTVTHAMFGPSPLISKLMSLVFNMEKMVGPKFEEGLANMKVIAEK